MDERDLKILKAVTELGTDNLEAVAAETNIAKSTVHYRLERLQEQGIIKNDLWEIEFDSLGLAITVISEVVAKYAEDYHEQVGAKISAVQGVNKVYWTMGEVDFIAIAHLPSQEHLRDLFQRYESIDEVQRTNSTYVIDTIKDERFPIRDYEISVLIDELDDG
jgi:DNA-binding Lrp family transcriptional regulator